MMRAALGSTSKHKIAAVREAFLVLGMQVNVIAEKVSSGQNEQPIGLRATFDGAFCRTLMLSVRHADIPCIGIESGIVPITQGTTIDLAVVIVRMPPDGRCYVATSSGIKTPQECFKEAERRGFSTTTVGAVLAERCGGDATDPITTLTNGTLTRVDVLATGISLALAQIPRFQLKA